MALIKNILFVIVFLMGFNLSLSEETRLYDNLEQLKQYQELVKQIRCVQCQNQTIEDSNARIAQDLRQVVIEQIKQGKDSPSIMIFLEERYGEFINYSPSSSKHWLLYILPIVFILLGIFLIFQLFKRKNNE